MFNISIEKKDQIFRVCFVLGTVGMFILAIVGVVCYFTLDVFPGTAYYHEPSVVIGCSIAILALSGLSLLPSLWVYLHKDLPYFSRSVWGVVMVIMACLEIILYIVPLLMAGA